MQMIETAKGATQALDSADGFKEVSVINYSIEKCDCTIFLTFFAAFLRRCTFAVRKVCTLLEIIL
jgi:hypothetical protein